MKVVEAESRLHYFSNTSAVPVVGSISGTRNLLLNSTTGSSDVPSTYTQYHLHRIVWKQQYRGL